MNTEILLDTRVHLTPESEKMNIVYNSTRNCI